MWWLYTGRWLVVGVVATEVAAPVGQAPTSKAQSQPHENKTQTLLIRPGELELAGRAGWLAGTGREQHEYEHEREGTTGGRREGTKGSKSRALSEPQGACDVLFSPLHQNLTDSTINRHHRYINRDLQDAGIERFRERWVPGDGLRWKHPCLPSRRRSVDHKTEQLQPLPMHLPRVFAVAGLSVVD